ncbi:MAG: fluoride efflux transporter CrcB [Devosia sp.]
MYPYLLVAIGGALGSVARFGAGAFVGRFWSGGFPLATLLINIVGSLAMGLIAGWLARATPAWQEDARLFVAVGVLGGFTTFSAFSLDTMNLIERGEIGAAVLYVGLSVVAAIAGLYAGLLIIRGGAA